MKNLISLFLAVALTVPLLAVSVNAANEIDAPPPIITETLQTVMEENTDETTRVAIWLKDIDTDEALATNAMPSYQERLAFVTATEENSTATNEIDRGIEVKRAALNLCYEPYTANVGADLLTDDEIVYASSYLPLVIADLSDERVAEVAQNATVEKMDFYCDEYAKETATEIDDTEVGSRSVVEGNNTYYTPEENFQFINGQTLRLHMNSLSNVKVGIIDGGNPMDHAIFQGKVTIHYPTMPNGDESYSNPVYLVESWNANELELLPKVATSPHPTHILEILVNAAPYAHFYYATYDQVPTATLAGEVEWLVDCGVNVITTSLDLFKYYYLAEDADPNEQDDGGYIGSETSDDGSYYGFIAQYIDRIVSYYNVTFVQCAGNAALNPVQPGAIASGAMAYNSIVVGNYDRGRGEISSGSAYYVGTTYGYKPDISAPGFYSFSTTSSNGSGTSYSTPLTAGVIALMMSYRPALKANPALVKAILLAGVSTNTAHHYDPTDENYIKYGAGLLDAGNIYTILQNQTYISSEMGTDGVEISHTIALTSPKLTRIVLNVERCNTVSDLTDETVYPSQIWYDADLRVEAVTGSFSISSTASRDTKEIVEFTSSISGSYRIYIDAFGSEYSETEIAVSGVPYALAWLQVNPS